LIKQYEVTNVSQAPNLQILMFQLSMGIPTEFAGMLLYYLKL